MPHQPLGGCGEKSTLLCGQTFDPADLSSE